MRVMRSRRLAPVPAAMVLPVWPKSWKCRSSTPALTHARRQTVCQLLRRIVAPLGPVNSWPSGSGSANLARCTRSSGTIASGIAIVRTPAALVHRVRAARQVISVFGLTRNFYAKDEILPLFESKAMEIPVTFYVMHPWCESRRDRYRMEPVEAAMEDPAR
jgi:hypothetical protein